LKNRGYGGLFCREIAFVPAIALTAEGSYPHGTSFIPG
jgi:hypothetical protein